MYDKDNDISRIFLDDSRDKKRTAIGIHKRASRRGYIRGGIRTQSDFMTAKQRRSLSGEVKVYSMYDVYANLENCNLQDILAKDPKEITKILDVIKANNSASKVCKRFSISSSKLYSYYREYGVALGRTSEPVDPANILIAKERFKLMDTSSKGKYLVEITTQHSITLKEIADYWKIPKGTLGHYTSTYRKKPKEKTKRVEAKQLTLPVKEVPVAQVQKATELENSKPPELEEAARRIAELEDTNNKLAERLLELTMQRSNTSKFRVEINGEYSKVDLSNRLLSLDYLTVENKMYKITLVLEES